MPGRLPICILRIFLTFFLLSRRQHVSFIPNLSKYGGRLYFLPRRDPNNQELEKSSCLQGLVEKGTMVFNVKEKKTGMGADSLTDPEKYHRVIDDLRYFARAMFPCFEKGFKFSSASEFRQHNLKSMCAAVSGDLPDVASRNLLTHCKGGRSRSASAANHQSNVIQGGYCFVLRLA